MAVVTVVLSMCLTSCDDDDDDYYDGDPVNIVNTRWKIIDHNDGSLNYGNGAYVDFYDGYGEITEGSEHTSFNFNEYSSISIQLDFDGGSMCGEWQYTSGNENVAVFTYYWTDKPNENYTMTLEYVQDL